MDEAKFLNELADEMTTAGRPATAGKLRAGAARIAELEGENAKMRDGLMRIRTCTDCPTLDMGDMRKGLHCGLEDRNIDDGYDAADYGFEDATERWIEWARNEADAALTPPTKEAP